VLIVLHALVLIGLGPPDFMMGVSSGGMLNSGRL
jgi:hypothetical protein